MANRYVHSVTGIIAGVTMTAALAPESPRSHLVAEVLGGSLGGWVGTRLPDVLEPAKGKNPRRHRKFAHSYTMAGGIVAAYGTIIQNGVTACRDAAAGCHAVRQADDMPAWKRILYQILEFLASLAAGFLNGIGPGYLSHQFLDALSPCGIPMLA